MTTSRRGLELLLLLSSVLRLGHCTEILWTPAGVQDRVSEPLVVELGDKLVFRCDVGVYSNVWIMTNQTHYDDCDCSEDAEGCSKLGECLGVYHPIDLDIRQNTNVPRSAIRIEVGTTYYFTSFSDGTRDGDQYSDRSSGGECSSVGLKAQVRVVVAPTEPPLPSPSSSSPSSSSPSLSPTPSSSSPLDENPIEPGSGPIVDGPMDNTGAPSIPGGEGGDEDTDLPENTVGESSGLGAVDGPNLGSPEPVSSARGAVNCHFLTCLSVVLCSVLGTLLRH